MSTSTLVRLLSFTLFSLIFFIGCANNLKTNGPGQGDSGVITDPNDPLYNGPVTGELPPRDEANNPATYDFNTLAPYTIYFAFDSFAIEPLERAKLEKTAEYLKEHANTKVFLAGHTDSRGTTQYNLGLGERRAIATREYLIGLGVPQSRLQTISYGEEQLVDSGESEAAYAKNRRVAAGIK